MTEAFFKLPDSHDVITRFETTVFCIANDDGFARPAPMDYDPKTQGTLIQCHKYESEFALRNGYGYMLNSSNPVNAHDCPPGTICKNDLEDGYMVDFWLVIARYDCLFKSMS
jgi:nitrite reductase/ring-hydroxylating ferredoxin subunit